MRVIRRSNYAHEDWRGDQYFVTCRLSERRAAAVAKALNDLEDLRSDDIFVVVPDDYDLPPDWQP
jgi:hypothetical protein